MDHELPEGRYANDFRVGHNAFEFVLDFGQLYLERNEAHVHSRIITSPTYAKAILRTLQESLERYEAQFGVVPEADYDSGRGRTEHARQVPSTSVVEHGRSTMPDRPDQPKPGAYQPPRPPQEPPSYAPPHPGEPPRYGSSWQREPGPPYEPPPPSEPPYGQYPPPQPPAPYEPPKQEQPPQYGAPPPPASGYPPQHGEPECPAPKPSDQVSVLKSKLAEQESTLTTLTKRRDTLKSDITGLEVTVTELTKVLTEYKEACKGLDTKKNGLDLYVATKTPMLEAAVKDKKPAIERCISDIDQWLAGWDHYVDHLERQARDADARSTSAAKEAEDRQAAYDLLKNDAKHIEAKLTELTAVRKQIEEEDDKNNPCSMYFLMKELKTALDGIRIRTPKELECDLYCAWNDLSTAKEEARDARAESDAAKELLAAKKTARGSHVTKRRDTILKCVNEVCPPPPPAPPKC